jgi:hypothetical protein
MLTSPPIRTLISSSRHCGRRAAINFSPITKLLVERPAYEALKHDDRTGSRMLEILLRGVSTRNYAKVLPEMAESVGISTGICFNPAAEYSNQRWRKRFYPSQRHSRSLP